jgi:hypothetical protein
MIRSFNLFSFSRLEAGVIRKAGDTVVFPIAPSVSDPLDILARKDEVRLVIMDVDATDAGLLLLRPSSADRERDAACFGEAGGVICSIFRSSPSTNKDDGL